MKYLIAALVASLSVSAFADDDTDFMLKGRWATLAMLKDPATKVEIESNSVRRDQYPEVMFSIRYVLTGSESERGLSSEHGQYNVKVVKMALDCDERKSAIFQNLFWFIDHNAKTVAFKGKAWGTSNWLDLSDSSFFWDVLPAICHS